MVTSGLPPVFLGLQAKNGFYKGIMTSNLMIDNTNFEPQYEHVTLLKRILCSSLIGTFK